MGTAGKLAALWALALAAALGWWARRRRSMPTVTEIRADALTFEDLVRRAKRIRRIEKPYAYARILFIRAYGKAPAA